MRFHSWAVCALYASRQTLFEKDTVRPSTVSLTLQGFPQRPTCCDLDRVVGLCVQCPYQKEVPFVQYLSGSTFRGGANPIQFCFPCPNCATLQYFIGASNFFCSRCFIRVRVVLTPPMHMSNTPVMVTNLRSQPAI